MTHFYFTSFTLSWAVCRFLIIPIPPDESKSDEHSFCNFGWDRLIFIIFEQSHFECRSFMQNTGHFSFKSFQKYWFYHIIGWMLSWKKRCMLIMCTILTVLWWKELKNDSFAGMLSRRHVFIFEFRSLERNWVLHFEPKLRISNCGISYYIIYTKSVSI